MQRRIFITSTKPASFTTITFTKMSAIHCMSKAFANALKALPGRKSLVNDALQAIIDSFVQILCQDYQLEVNELVRAVAVDIKDQYVLLQGTGAQ